MDSTMATAPAVTVSQSLLLGIAVIALFGMQVLVTGLTAKKLDVFDVSYARALWASVVVNASSVACRWLVLATSGFSQIVPILLAVTVPVVSYKLVFSCTLKQAILIWVAVLMVGTLAGAVLVLGALWMGSWLDMKFNLPMTNVAHWGRPI
jgi:hypothetical protein